MHEASARAAANCTFFQQKIKIANILDADRTLIVKQKKTVWHRLTKMVNLINILFERREGNFCSRAVFCIS